MSRDPSCRYCGALINDGECCDDCVDAHARADHDMGLLDVRDWMRRRGVAVTMRCTRSVFEVTMAGDGRKVVATASSPSDAVRSAMREWG